MDRRSEMTAREYAASLGLAKMGRGRMSPAAKQAIAKAESEGVVFKLPAHVLAAQERAESGPKRIRKASTPNNSREAVIVEGKPSNAVKLGEDGKPTHPPLSWYEKVFAFGNFVCNPQGMTLRVVSEFPDSEGFTHFIDKTGKKWHAKVNGSWGVRKGWPEGGVSVSDDN
jgi:hypothetical protein